LSNWVLYDSVGNAGFGTRSPSAISFADNVMTITGDTTGTSEGMAWSTGQKYGAWEVRMRAPAGATDYDPVLLLWPDAENWPKGGEIDFMEIYQDPTRQNVGVTVHYSAKNKQVGENFTIDATEWHNYAVTWTPTAITVYVDGVQIYRTSNKSTFPPGSMHLCIQLDAVGTNFSPGAQMQVAWARQYSLSAITSRSSV
jgi:beta-glucanase (GH16 family)